MKALSWRLSVALIIALMLSACGTTPPSSHYRLTALQTLPTNANGPSLGVGPVNIPEYLNRDAMVRSDGANSLSIDNGERWAEPLEDGITRVVILNLAGLLNTQDIRRFPWHPDRAPNIGIKLNVLKMDTETARATLVAEWSVYRVNHDEPISRRLSRYEEPMPSASSTGGDIAAAYSALLASLSRDMAEEARGLVNAAAP
ncbi:MAG: PqiC family protein [Halioglobus sp.]